MCRPALGGERIGMRLRDPLNSELTRWRLTAHMDAVVESENKERGPRVSTRFSLGVENKWTDVIRDGRSCIARPSS